MRQKAHTEMWGKPRPVQGDGHGSESDAHRIPAGRGAAPALATIFSRAAGCLVINIKHNDPMLQARGGLWRWPFPV